MLESMTGFGRGTATAAGTAVTVEVRAVNGRYADVTVRAPRALAERESEVQQRVKAALERGKATVHVQAEQPATETGLRVDADAARSYAALLDDLRRAAGVAAPVSLGHLLQFKDVLAPVEAETDDAALWAATEAALEEALGALRQMRRQEGEALGADLRERLGAIEAELDAVEAAAPARVEAARARLHDRLADLLGDDRVDAERLEVEIALLAEKLDVNEEVVRLRSHLAQFREALDAEEPVGRRLNFLAQELNREINTIASKANDAGIAHRAVAMKEELERIREQVQNVV